MKKLSNRETAVDYHRKVYLGVSRSWMALYFLYFRRVVYKVTSSSWLYLRWTHGKCWRKFSTCAYHLSDVTWSEDGLLFYSTFLLKNFWHHWSNYLSNLWSKIWISWIIVTIWSKIWISLFHHTIQVILYQSLWFSIRNTISIQKFCVKV